MNLHIASIADHLDLVPTIAGWHYDEWGHLDSEGTLESWTTGLAERVHRDRIPTTFVAFDGTTPVGSAVLVEHDMDTRRDLSPWLAGLFVIPSHRLRGIARALVLHTMSEARAIGVTTLYLYTHDAESLYAALGWRAIGREFYEGRWVSLMSVALAAGQEDRATEA